MSHDRRFKIWSRMFASSMFILCSYPANAADGKSRLPPVCDNNELLKAIRSIDAACNEQKCDFSRLIDNFNKIEKRTLLAVMKSPELYGIYVFYPKGASKPELAYDWQAKKDQLGSLKEASSSDENVIYIIGRASAPGNASANRALAKERARGIMEYLKNEVKVRCHDFHTAYFGEEVMALNESDTAWINVYPGDYKSSVEILNQSVHVLVFPCRSRL